MDETSCGDAYTDPKRIAFREAVVAAMDAQQVDALIYRLGITLLPKLAILKAIKATTAR